MDKRRPETVRLDLDEVRRLARELASRRDSAYAEMQGEVEQMKASLRERAAAIAQRERRLAELEHRVGANGLAEELAAAQRAAAEAEAERRLAAAERDRLDEREQQIRAVEKELAALRIELGQKPTPPPARRPTASARQKELDAREAALDEREAALEAREAALRGDTMSMPSPLGFADGLAALTRPDAG
jgi:chromosome segregation ATPase